MGHGRFLLFYLLAGIVAAYGQALVDIDSTVPMIGASGALAGLLGAYLLLYAEGEGADLRARDLLLHRSSRSRRWSIAGLWFGLQFVPAVGQLADDRVLGPARASISPT